MKEKWRTKMEQDYRIQERESSGRKFFGPKLYGGEQGDPCSGRMHSGPAKFVPFNLDFSLCFIAATLRAATNLPLH